MTTQAELLEGAAKSKAPKPLPSIGLRAISGPIPSPKWVVEGLRIAAGGITLFAGYGDSAKTLFLEYLTLCVVSGTPVFGIYPVEQGSGIHLDYEQGDRLSRERTQRLARGHGIDLDALPDNALRLAVFPELYLDAPEAEGILKATMEEQPTEFFVFDSLKAATPDTEENGSAARKTLDMLTHVCGDSRAGWGIQHSRKMPSNARDAKEAKADPRMMIRGSSALYDACQGVFVFMRDRGDQNSPIQVHHVKERIRGRTIPSFGFCVVDVPDPNDPNDAHWGLRVDYVAPESLDSAVDASEDPAFSAACQSVFAAILTNGAGPPLRIIMADTRRGDATVRQCLARLVATGHIEGREEKRPRAPMGTYYYALPGVTAYTPPSTAGIFMDPEPENILNV